MLFQGKVLTEQASSIDSTHVEGLLVLLLLSIWVLLVLLLLITLAKWVIEELLGSHLELTLAIGHFFFLKFINLKN